MNWLERLIYHLSGEMTRPDNYGWFHLMFLGIVIALSVVFCLCFSRSDQKTERRILLIGWIVIVLFEIYKQLQFSLRFGETTEWDYSWYAFPFQFCSSPLYLLPIAALAKEGRVRDAVRMFLATFAFFAGICVFVFPDTVFIRTIGINIQTMIHHGLQVVFGVFLGVRLMREKKMTFRYFEGACAVFLCMVAAAFALNVSAPLFTDETFNMFYIGPRFPCTLVILDRLYAILPYPLFLLLYVAGFCFAAFLLFGIFRLAAFCASKRRSA